jgi:hypothetical protein
MLNYPRSSGVFRNPPDCTGVTNPGSNDFASPLKSASLSDQAPDEKDQADRKSACQAGQ